MVMYTQKKENLSLTGKKINYNLYNLRETVGENQMCWILRHILVCVSVFGCFYFKPIVLSLIILCVIIRHN